MEFPFGVFLLTCICKTPVFSQDAPMITPSFAVLFPGSEVIFSCNNASAVVVWSIDGIITSSNDFPAGVSNVNDTTLRVNMSVNATMYGCGIVISGGNIIRSNIATLALAATPANVTNVMINLATVNINSIVSFTLNWDDPFDNFDPIVNYTITINCSDASCPVMFIVTRTSANVFFITDLSMMTPLSVTATNTIGTSDPTTIRIAVPDAVSLVNIMCSPMDEMNQCIVTWNATTINPNITDAVNAPVKYIVSIFGDNIDNRTLTVEVPMATIDNLPAVDSDVNVFVIAMNVFGSADPSTVAVDKILASSLVNLVSSMVPNVTMNTYFIVVMCGIDPGLIIQSCEVIARNDRRTVIGSATVTDNIASVTVDLVCEETYIITAVGINDSMLVGPRLRQATNVIAGPCPTTSTMSTGTVILSVTLSTTVTTTTPQSQPPGETSDDDNTGGIVGGVVGGIIAAIILIIIIIILVLYCMKKRKKSSPPVAMRNIPVYDTVQDPVVSDKIKMENNPAYQEIPSRKGPDPSYQDLLSHSARANVSKPAGDVNYYEDIINNQNIKMTENPSYAVP